MNRREVYHHMETIPPELTAKARAAIHIAQA
jgi:hypothetical protein